MKDALKLALDLAIMHHSDGGYAELRLKVRQLAKEALAQDEQSSSQEPVAFISPGGHIHYDPYLDSVPLYTTPSKEQQSCDKRPWVGLTDEETKEQIKRSDLLDMFEHIGWYSAPRKGFDKNAILLIQAIEATLKEKNT